MTPGIYRAKSEPNWVMRVDRIDQDQGSAIVLSGAFIGEEPPDPFNKHWFIKDEWELVVSCLKCNDTGRVDTPGKPYDACGDCLRKM